MQIFVFANNKIKTGMGTQFNSQVTRKVAAVLGVELKDASAKHAQTIGMLERTHVTVKTVDSSKPAKFAEIGTNFCS